MATELALAYLIEAGAASDLPVDFARHYTATWVGIGVLGALACNNGDTWASEIGAVMGVKNPRLITTLRKVPRGTNGGVSFVGLVVSLLGGLVVGVGYLAGVLLFADAHELSEAPAQWPVIVLGGIGGLLGSLIDSLLGATLQFSGKCRQTGSIVEEPGRDVIPISGMCVLGNHAVNLLASVLTGLCLPKIAVYFYTFL